MLTITLRNSKLSILFFYIGFFKLKKFFFRFCKDKLLLLNPFDNQFLYFQHSINSACPLNFFVNKKVWVEIYYTDNIPMRWYYLFIFY
jgi:hypothetical protein